MIILMKCLNEQNMVKRVISDFHDEKWVDRVIVIDGGSSDFTRIALNNKKLSKVEVYVHPWDFDYHDNEVSQSNIALSYVPLNELAFIMDFDERMSPELKETLAKINTDGIPEYADTAHFSRRSYELMRHEDSPFAIEDDDGWFLLSHEIGQYPDYQLRLIKRRVGMHWINSPHHVMFGVGEIFTTVNISADIIHYHGKEDARQRQNVEIGWLRTQARRKELGLGYDVFECKPQNDMHKYAQPEYWK